MSTAIKVPKTMAGVQISRTGGPEVLEYKTDLPVPIPKAGEVLVKNESIGVNYIDTYVPVLVEVRSRMLINWQILPLRTLLFFKTIPARQGS
jgi:hypothetical protein